LKLVKRQRMQPLAPDVTPFGFSPAAAGACQPSSVAADERPPLWSNAPLELLRISPNEAKGCGRFSPAEAVPNIGSTPRGPVSTAFARAQFAYAYTARGSRPEPSRDKRRKQYIEARELLAAHIESAWCAMASVCRVYINFRLRRQPFCLQMPPLPPPRPAFSPETRDGYFVHADGQIVD